MCICKYKHEITFHRINDLIEVLDGNEEFEDIFDVTTVDLIPAEYSSVCVYSKPYERFEDSYRIVFTSNIKDAEKAFQNTKSQIINEVIQHLEEVSEFYNGEYSDISDYGEE